MKKTLLIVDAGNTDGDTWTSAIAGAKGVEVRRAMRILPGQFDDLMVVDYGDPLSAQLVAEAVAYRAEHPGCRVTVNRVLADHWSTTESHARVLGDPTNCAGRTTMDLHSFGSLLRREDRFEVKIRPDAILLEYAA